MYSVFIIPTIFTIGLFICIGIGSYLRYKRTVLLAQQFSPDQFNKWYHNMLLYKIISNRGWALRWGGFIVGGGIGSALGGWIHIAMGNTTLACFLIAAIILIGAGAGLIGAYFLERKLDHLVDKFDQPQ